MEAIKFGELVQGLTYEEYDSTHPMAVRASSLKLVKRAPAYFPAAKRNPKSTAALEFGKLFHSAMENGEKFLDLMHVAPDVDRRTKAGKEAVLNFESRLPKDAIIVDTDEAHNLAGMIKAVQAHRVARNIIKNGTRETSLWVQDDETPEILKCRLDVISDTLEPVDFKTTEDASERAFLNQIYSDKFKNDPFYVLGAAHYTRCMRLAKLLRQERFTYVAVEKEDPWRVEVYPLDLGCIAPGEQWRSHLTKIYSECRIADHWPINNGMAKRVVPPEWVSLPPTGDEQ